MDEEEVWLLVSALRNVEVADCDGMTMSCHALWVEEKLATEAGPLGSKAASSTSKAESEESSESWT